jgi:transposase
MDKSRIFSATLGLFAPWHISAIALSEKGGRIDINVETTSDEPLACPVCGATSSLNSDYVETWCHHNFFSHTAYIHIRIPRITCPDCEDIHALPLPWSEESSLVRLNNPPAPSVAV